MAEPVQPDRTSPDLTRVLAAVSDGDPAARARLLDLVYDELHRLAADYMRGERADHTLQSTALVSEAYVRLFGATQVRWDNRAHFFSAAAEVMRRILIDHARHRVAAKRGGGQRRDALDDPAAGTWVAPDELLAISDAVEQLARTDEEKARVVKLRFFAGLSVEETAAVMGLSERTVKRHWRFARAWLFRKLSEGHSN